MLAYAACSQLSFCFQGIYLHRGLCNTAFEAERGGAIVCSEVVPRAKQEHVIQGLQSVLSCGQPLRLPGWPSATHGRVQYENQPRRPLTKGQQRRANSRLAGQFAMRKKKKKPQKQSRGSVWTASRASRPGGAGGGLTRHGRGRLGIETLQWDACV